MRAVAVAILVLAVAMTYLAMWRGWRSRAARQADLPPLPVPPAVTGPSLLPAGPVEATYVGTSVGGPGGSWLDRVVAQGLARRSAALVDVTTDGVRVDRSPDTTVFLPTAALRHVRLEQAVAGKATLEAGGLLAITWDHGGRELDCGLRLRHRADADRVLAAVRGLLATSPREGAR